MKTFQFIIGICSFFCATPAWTQTVFATETFQASAAPKGTTANGYLGDMGTWTVLATGVNGAAANEWYVSGEECGNAAGTCGSACPGGDNSLHLSAIGGLCGTPDCGAAYDATAAANITNKRAISPTIDCTGNFMIELNFNYIAAQDDDDFFVEYSANNGASWVTLPGGIVAASGCCCLLPGFCGIPDPIPCTNFLAGQGYWTAVNFALPASADNNPNVRIAFHWSNDGDGLGDDPSAAIDDITLTYAIILNTELADFSGEATDNLNLLTWTTLSESNSDYFLIEHSRDGVQFSSIGSVPAAHESNSTKNYSFMHEAEYALNYYRLKSVDMNGSHTFSEVISVENDFSRIHLSRLNGSYVVKGLENSSGEISVFNLSGALVKPPVYFDAETAQIELNFGDIEKGIYIVVVNGSLGHKQFKILI